MTPDLAELKRIAEAATQSEWSAEQLEHPRYNAAPPSWEFWVNIPTGTDLFLDAGPSPDEPNAQFTANTPHGYSDHDGQAWRDVQFIAAAKPKAVLALIARIEALEAGLKSAAARFRHYEQLHAAKGSPDGDAKAQNNADMAQMIEVLLDD